ncbi:MAG: helix-turn-helix domain-containing protein [Planctomycetales bacterium]
MPRSASIAVPFLVYPENQFAHAAVLALCESAELRSTHSVFLYGSAGVGKSQLAALGVSLALAASPQAKVQQWTASQFAAEFSEAASKKTIPLFQSATRQCDFLVMEDVQVLEGRPETLVQLLSLANELASSGGRILWSCHKSPGALSGFPPKLISRFRGGVLAPLRMPEAESRRRLVQHVARWRRIAASPRALTLLADELAVSPRELVGALERLTALTRHDRCALDVDLVRRFLAHDLPPPKLTLEDICRAVAQQFGTTVAELRSPQRARRFALPRQCAMWLARELTSNSLQQIGRHLGGRDHSTVIHSCQRLRGLLDADPDLRSQLNQVRYLLGAPPCELETEVVRGE